MMLFGWAIGLIIAGLVLRLGLGAESLAWAAIFFIQPFSARLLPGRHPAAPSAGSPTCCPRPRCSRACGRSWSSTASTWALFAQAVAVLLVWLVVGGDGLHAPVPQRAPARAAAAERRVADGVVLEATAGP